jgi:hypothetical protein
MLQLDDLLGGLLDEKLDNILVCQEIRSLNGVPRMQIKGVSFS